MTDTQNGPGQFLIIEEDSAADIAADITDRWKILIADDEESVHSVTRMVLEDVVFEGRGLEFISAFSGAEARRILAENRDIAVILLDVVMETVDAGLAVVRYVREELRNRGVRIVLRTGQPGAAPPERVIVDYDINDYTEKTDLTAQRLFASIIASLRSYQDITTRKRAEQERLANLKYFESMDKVNQAMQGTKGLEEMMHDVLGTVLAIFDCDRAYLMYPCDPASPAWHIPMERTKPEYPGVPELAVDMPMDVHVEQTLRLLLESDGPVKFGPGTQHPLPESVAERYGCKSCMAMAVYPKTDRPWQFGLHQCSFARSWTPEEERLFREIGRRLGDTLSSLLAYRNLRESEKFLNNVVENIPNMIFIKDAETLKFVRFNKNGEKLLGFSREELIGRNDYDFFPKEVADFFTTKDRLVLSTRELVDIPEETIRTRDNHERILHTQKIPILDEKGNARYLLGISEDITERKKLEDQLRQAQKMEAVGRLAGGVAHDFNNMLSVIIGHSELALLGLSDPDQPLAANLRQIRNAARRSAELTRQLLGFARKQTINPRPLDLNKTVAGMLKMLRPLLGEDVDFVWRPGTAHYLIKIDPTQIDQILANLCVNARDAITGVGKITIETEKVTFDEDYCADHPGFIPGDFAMLAVSDNGQGMEKEVLDKIFEPFFTTKGKDKGTGLGLATIYGIIKQNNGFINVYSEPGHGTTFKIYFPLLSSAQPAVAEKKSRALPQPLGHETILLVEDESALLDMVRLMLESLGYVILTAATPGEALRLSQSYMGELHLLLTDVIMPEMNGRELANRLLRLRPGVKLLFMSGYTGNAIAHHGILDEGVHFIQKPFAIDDLAARVREVLDT